MKDGEAEWNSNILPRLERKDRILRQTHFRKGKEEGERRFRSLVLIGPIDVQTVAAAAGLRVEERNSQVIAAEKPVKCPPRFPQPEFVSGCAMGLEACAEHGVRLDGLLIESRRRFSAFPKAIGANRSKVAEFSGLILHQPVEGLEAGFQHVASASLTTSENESL